MPDLHYLLKRSIIVLGYVALFSVIAFLIHFIITPRDTCFDNKKNQNETGVDCGGSCKLCQVVYVEKELTIIEKTFVAGGNNTYDSLIKISNPNDSVGASFFHYVITLKDDAGRIVSTKEGDDYVLPADTKYITQLGLEVTGNTIPSQIYFAISGVKWSQITQITKPQLNVYNKRFGPDANGIGSRAEGLVRNESSNDFKKINVIVVLRDENGVLLGVSMTQEDNVRAQKESGFVLTWPYAFSKVVRSMEVDVQANVYDPQNFSTGL